jgi:hypothetical protein
MNGYRIREKDRTSYTAREDILEGRRLDALEERDTEEK